jgi:dihydroorotate dehydrogenase (fumarate)
MSERLDLVKRAEDAGAAAIVMNSLFEEQIVREQLRQHYYVDSHAHSHAEAQSFFAAPADTGHDLEAYLRNLERVKRSVSIPVIGSLNGASDHGWLSYARFIEQAGADALELNIYHLSLQPDLTSKDVEQGVVDMVSHARRETSLPIAVKLAPTYAAPVHLGMRLVEAGVQGLVVFNRFYEPDIDIDKLELVPRMMLSSPQELPARLRWLGAMFGQVRASLAVTGGVHTGIDAMKAVMAGADGVQMVSALMKHGPEHLALVLMELKNVLEEYGYESLEQARGSMSLARCPDPSPYHRGNTVRMLQG